MAKESNEKPKQPEASGKSQPPNKKTWKETIVDVTETTAVMAVGAAAPIPSGITKPIVHGAREILEGGAPSLQTQQSLLVGFQNAAVGGLAAAALFFVAPAGAGLGVAVGLAVASASIATGLEAGPRISAAIQSWVKPSAAAAPVVSSSPVAVAAPEQRLDVAVASHSVEKAVVPEVQASAANPSPLREALANPEPSITQSPRGPSSSPRASSPKPTSREI